MYRMARSKRPDGGSKSMLIQSFILTDASTVSIGRGVRRSFPRLRAIDTKFSMALPARKINRSCVVSSRKVPQIQCNASPRGWRLLFPVNSPNTVTALLLPPHIPLSCSGKPDPFAVLELYSDHAWQGMSDIHSYICTIIEKGLSRAMMNAILPAHSAVADCGSALNSSPGTSSARSMIKNTVVPLEGETRCSRCVSADHTCHVAGPAASARARFVKCLRCLATNAGCHASFVSVSALVDVVC